jgi:hypothetical protein
MKSPSNKGKIKHGDINIKITKKKKKKNHPTAVVSSSKCWGGGGREGRVSSEVWTINTYI